MFYSLHTVSGRISGRFAGILAASVWCAPTHPLPQVVLTYSSPGFPDFRSGMINFMSASPGTISIVTPPLVSLPFCKA